MNQSFIHYLNDTEKIKPVDSLFKVFNMIVTSTIKKQVGKHPMPPKESTFLTSASSTILGSFI